MHRFKPPWSTFNSLRKMSGSNTLARSPSASGPFRRCSHETKTSSPPHTPADEVLPANGGIGDDFAGGCIGYLLSRNRPALSDRSRRSLPAVRSLDQLRRDPHILGWLASLRSHNPPLATATRLY